MVSSVSSRDMEISKGGIRDSRESDKHRMLIRKIAMAYDRDGYKVKADHIDGFETPEKCVMMRPDIKAVKDGEEIIVEVESENSAGSRRDRMQRQEFSEWAKKSEKRDFRRETVT